MENIQGLLAAVYTPLTDNGELNLELVGGYANWLVQNKVKGAFINGSTGDFASLTTNERKIILEEWCKYKPDDFTIVSQVGHTSLKDSMDLASHAAQLNVDAIAIVGPYYNKPSTVEDLVNICRRTAEAAPNLPFYYYHIPGLTGVDFSMVEFLRLASQTIPSLRGIKYSKQDLVDYTFCKNFENGHYDILWGMDELVICGLCLGAQGMVGTTYNHIPQLYYEIISCFDENRIPEASALQLKSMSFIKTLRSYGFAGAGKSCMKLAGLNCGPVRPPDKNLSSSNFIKLKQELSNLDLLQYFPEGLLLVE